MITQKKNVSEFNKDVKENEGYRYTTNAPFSSIVANKRMTDATIAFIPKSVKTLIDIGCGDGTYTNDLKQILSDIHYTGFDPASDAIEIAKKKFSGIEYIVGDLLNKETFPKKKYDVAIIRGVIHHLPDAAKGIANAVELSDNIIIIEPNGNNPILKYIEKNSQYHIEHEEQSYTSNQLVAWCEAAGYKVSKVDYVGFVPFFFPTLLAKIIYFFQPFLELIHPLKKYFGAQIVILYQRK